MTAVSRSGRPTAARPGIAEARGDRDLSAGRDDQQQREREVGGYLLSKDAEELAFGRARLTGQGECGTRPSAARRTAISPISRPPPAVRDRGDPADSGAIRSSLRRQSTRAKRGGREAESDCADLARADAPDWAVSRLRATALGGALPAAQIRASHLRLALARRRMSGSSWNFGGGLQLWLTVRQ
jgi:hypothetical protein